MSKLKIPEVLKETNGKVQWAKESLGFTKIEKVKLLFAENGFKGEVLYVDTRGGYAIVIYKCLVCQKICEPFVSNLINGKTCKHCAKAKMSILQTGRNKGLYNPPKSVEDAQKLIDVKQAGKWKAKGLRYVKYGKWNCLVIDAECLVCGETETKLVGHWRQGIGCSNCNNLRKSIAFRSNTEAFIRKARDKHGLRYGYDNVNYETSYRHVSITCHVHGDFAMTPNHHLNGRGCPTCNNSHGELAILKILQSLNVPYEDQKPFKGCKDKGSLKFDFLLPELGIVIEYHGRQHYEFVETFHINQEGFEDSQRRDRTKCEFCEDNGFIFVELDSRKFTVKGQVDEDKILRFIRRTIREVKNGEWPRKNENWRTLVLEDSESMGK